MDGQSLYADGVNIFKKKDFSKKLTAVIRHKKKRQIFAFDGRICSFVIRSHGHLVHGAYVQVGQRCGKRLCHVHFDYL